MLLFLPNYYPFIDILVYKRQWFAIELIVVLLGGNSKLNIIINPFVLLHL